MQRMDGNFFPQDPEDGTNMPNMEGGVFREDDDVV